MSAQELPPEPNEEGDSNGHSEEEPFLDQGEARKFAKEEMDDLPWPQRQEDREDIARGFPHTVPDTGNGSKKGKKDKE